MRIAGSVSGVRCISLALLSCLGRHFTERTASASSSIELRHAYTVGYRFRGSGGRWRRDNGGGNVCFSCAGSRVYLRRLARLVGAAICRGME